MVQVSYPGVYIEEFAPGAPIQGIGTSTPAFLGPLKNGPLLISDQDRELGCSTRCFDLGPDGRLLSLVCRPRVL